LHFVKTDHCTGGGAVVGEFFGFGGLSTIFLTGAFLSIRRFFCLDDGDDFDFYPKAVVLNLFGGTIITNQT